ncbi:phage tail termination protein [Rhodococcoides fascians]|uniref:phage tail termination protein n=1 Tax=Rhodococcoides fascians TaxID=1828 RepID=UPI00056A8C77|nr:hypothetical protein [Rhodococcus fascians]
MGHPDQEYPEYGEFPDVEEVLVDLLSPIIRTVTVLPVKEEQLHELMPLIWARRTGGALDGSEITDNAMVQFTVFADTRREAQQYARLARKAAMAAARTRVNGVLVDDVGEMAAPLEIPDLDPMNRTVQVAFVMSFRRQF